jgi:hypothetical protein
MSRVACGPSLGWVKTTFPVLWALDGQTHTGKLETLEGRFELTSRSHSLSFPRTSVTHYSVERRADARIRGLPAITVHLTGGQVVRVASMGGAGSLHEIAALVATPGGAPASAQELAGAGT